MHGIFWAFQAGGKSSKMTNADIDATPHHIYIASNDINIDHVGLTYLHSPMDLCEFCMRCDGGNAQIVAEQEKMLASARCGCEEFM